MKWLYLVLLVACHRGEAMTVDETVPEDEVWLDPTQIAKANIHVDEVALRDLPHAIHATGKIAFDDLHVTHVYSPVNGRVVRVLAKPGDQLKRGAPLLAVLSPDVGTAFSDVIKANADLQTSEADFRREQLLMSEDATSKRNYEAAEDAFRKAKAERDRAQQRASLLRSDTIDAVSQEYTLRTFLDGEVIARNVNPGVEVVGQYAGGTAAELFTIGDIKNVWVNIDVQDRDVPSLQVGDAVAVTVTAYPGRQFTGKLDYIASTVDPVLRTGRVRASLANPDELLKPEMYAAIAISQHPSQQVAVPHDAVVAINESKYVYVESGKRRDGRAIFKRHTVVIGTEADGFIPILDGLHPGERVVTQGSVSREQPNNEVWLTKTQLAKSQITTTAVTPRDLPEATSIGGRLTFDDSRISHVFSPVNGRITRLLAEPGQRVAKGAPLVAMTSQDVGTYLADLAKADADRTQAEHELQRQQELFANHIGAKRDLEAAEDALRKANADLDRSKALAQLVRSSDFDAVSQQYILRSPIEGEVIARRASIGLEVQGQYASGNAAELFTIGDTSQLWVLGDVYEMDLPHIVEGDDVVIHSDAADFHGRVEWISDVLDPVTHTAKLRCVVDNRDHQLRPEMYEAIDIVVPQKHVLAVPREAVMRVEGHTIVFVQTNKRKPDGSEIFERREIVAKLGESTPLVPVLSGLSDGETVAVTHSVMLLGLL